MRLSKKIMFGVSVIIIMVNIAMFHVVGWRYETQLREGLTESARSFYKLIVILRAWVSQHNGVFVKYQEGIEANPYLNMPGIRSVSGDSLVLRNPALVTRELSELSTLMGKRFRFHLTSLNPVNPQNTPDPFEKRALLLLQSGRRDSLTTYGEFTTFETIEGKPHFRYFAPLYTEESCLSCHGQQGYQVGDVRGGISILVPTDKVQVAKKQNYILMVFGGIFASVAISLLIFYVIKKTVIKPLQQLELAAENIGKGNYNTEISTNSTDEIGDLGKAMSNMQEAIRVSVSKQIETEKMFALGQLSAGIAHEIRNPLFAIRNDLDYLKRNFDPDKHHLEIYNEMEDGVSRISNTVNAVLDYSKPHKPAFGVYHVNELIERCMALLGKQLEKENIAITFSIAANLPPIEMDVHRMEQVLVNLLTNAKQAITGNWGKIEISAIRSHKFIQISVQDNGKGIKSSDLPRIFDPFFTRSPNGTGLGLTIVRQIVEQHNGFIKVNGEEGRGASFIIQIPIKQKWQEKS